MVSQADIYTDLSGLNSLKVKARQDQGAALKEVAGQFESLFVTMMMKSMRDASLGDGIFDNEQSEMYTSMFDQQMALDLSKRGGLGLADAIVRQLQGVSGQATSKSDQEFKLPERAPQVAKLAVTTQPGQAAWSAPAMQPLDPGNLAQDPKRFDNPEQFIETLWPHARKAGEEMGVSPELLLAQAALETGWGKSVIQGEGGKSSYNLFNIKADSRWEGERVAKTTVEFAEGVATKERAAFRSYDSYSESFADYVQFIKGSARYQEALKHGQDTGLYPQKLQEAGYATDPNYADKIRDILKRDEIVAVTDGLKLGTEVPLTKTEVL